MTWKPGGGDAVPDDHGWILRKCNATPALFIVMQDEWGLRKTRLPERPWRCPLLVSKEKVSGAERFDTISYGYIHTRGGASKNDHALRNTDLFSGLRKVNLADGALHTCRKK